MIGIAVALYVVALVAANLIIAQLGPVAAFPVALVLIGFDLTMRDWLNLRLQRWQMLGLIAGTGLLTFALNPAAGQIAIASAVAFTLAALADWLVFISLPGSWLVRSNASNVAGALVDSLVFPTLAFGALLPGIVAMQFVAKVAGGAIWSLLLRRVLPAQA